MQKSRYDFRKSRIIEMPTKHEINVTADEYDVLLRLAGRIQQVDGIALGEAQIVEAALEALRQDACVRQALKKRVASKLFADKTKDEKMAV